MIKEGKYIGTTPLVIGAGEVKTVKTNLTKDSIEEGVYCVYEVPGALVLADAHLVDGGLDLINASKYDIKVEPGALVAKQMFVQAYKEPEDVVVDESSKSEDASIIGISEDDKVMELSPKEQNKEVDTGLPDVPAKVILRKRDSKK